ncbi:MAG: hypothetical protein J0I06_20745 [Planctomycetes bacterium]|nr:hypothetical protein [Planctomycetota bacterium]
MPLLDWKELDFVQVLSVLPADEDGVQYTFDVSKGGARLVLDVWPYESAVGISLWAGASSEPITDLVAFVRGPAVRRETRESEWIELRDVVITPSRFSYLELGDPFDHERFPAGFPVRICATPQIRVDLVRERGTR